MAGRGWSAFMESLWMQWLLYGPLNYKLSLLGDGVLWNSQVSGKSSCRTEVAFVKIFMCKAYFVFRCGDRSQFKAQLQIVLSKHILIRQSTWSLRAWNPFCWGLSPELQALQLLWQSSCKLPKQSPRGDVVCGEPRRRPGSRLLRKVRLRAQISSIKSEKLCGP